MTVVFGWLDHVLPDAEDGPETEGHAGVPGAAQIVEAEASLASQGLVPRSRCGSPDGMNEWDEACECDGWWPKVAPRKSGEAAKRRTYHDGEVHHGEHGLKDRAQKESKELHRALLRHGLRLLVARLKDRAQKESKELHRACVCSWQGGV